MGGNRGSRSVARVQVVTAIQKTGKYITCTHVYIILIYSLVLAAAAAVEINGSIPQGISPIFSRIQYIQILI